MYKIKDKTKCSGCGACMNICTAGAITMSRDENGELYPYTDEKKCVSCGRCIKVCPYLSGAVGTRSKCHAIGYINDDEVRSLCSAGGVAAALSLCTAAEGGAVFGVRYDGVFSCVYDVATEISGIAELSGRKYVEGDAGHSYSRAKEILLSGGQVLFFGTPCRIAALNKFLGAPFENLVTVSVGCRGVVGGAVWRKYIESVGVPERVRLGNRLDSENACTLILEYDEDNIKHMVRRETPIHTAVESGIGVRSSCMSCAFAKKEYADISLMRYDPFVTDQSVSRMRQPMCLIGINSDKGVLAIEKAAGLITLKELDGKEYETYTKKRQGKKRQGSRELNKKFFKKLETDSFEESLSFVQKYSKSVKLNKKILKLFVK